MPVVLRLAGFKFLFYSNEGNPREPVHIHVRQGRDEAKFWLKPSVIGEFRPPTACYNCVASPKVSR